MRTPKDSISLLFFFSFSLHSFFSPNDNVDSVEREKEVLEKGERKDRISPG